MAFRLFSPARIELFLNPRLSRKLPAMQRRPRVSSRT
jgi:hypothetical protein